MTTTTKKRIESLDDLTEGCIVSNFNQKMIFNHKVNNIAFFITGLQTPIMYSLHELAIWDLVVEEKWEPKVGEFCEFCDEDDWPAEKILFGKYEQANTSYVYDHFLSEHDTCYQYVRPFQKSRLED